jgi:uncharacterized protein YecE (DUF72 family)
MTWVGVAGWDYPDWNGIVYPSGSSRGFDKLAWIARFVDAVEINATFYRPVKAAVAASWLRRVEDRPGFRFTAKAHRSWSHEMWDDPVPLRRATLEGLAPLHDAGVLGALLVQFPQSFHWIPENRTRLGRLLEGLDGWPVVVEVRHVSWDDDHAAAWMRELGAGFCVVDQPRAGTSILPFRPRVTSRVAYLRLHGRNAARWFDPAAGRDERYDYLYDPAELAPIADAARDMGGHANALYAIANNHFRGQAVANALQLKHLITGVAPEAPGELVEAYPELRAIVQVCRERLF